MSEIQPKTVVVNGQEYLFTKFMADRGLKVMVRLAKLMAEPLAKGAGIANLPQDSDAFMEGVGDILSALALRLDEDEVLALVEDLLSVVVPPGQTFPLADPLNPSRSTWKLHFQGRLADMGVVLFYSWKENFEDFLFVVKLAKSRLGAGPASARASRSQNT